MCIRCGVYLEKLNEIIVVVRKCGFWGYNDRLTWFSFARASAVSAKEEAAEQHDQFGHKVIDELPSISSTSRMSIWGHPSAAGIRPPAKPSLRMHTELDPQPEGGEQGGTLLSAHCSKFVRNTYKENHQFFTANITVFALMVMEPPLLNRTGFI